MTPWLRGGTVMLRRITLTALLLLASASALAQSPFEEIHGDILRKMDAMRAQAAIGRGPSLAPQPTPNQLLFDVQHYALDIAFNPTTHAVEGTVRATIESLTDALGSIDLDADNALTISSVAAAGGDPLVWSRVGGILTVSLPAPLANGAITTVEVSYSGFPLTAAHPGLFFTTVGGNPLIYSLSEPWSARTWWPCKDYPDDKATFDIRLSVPEGLTAASNGSYLGSETESRWGEPYRSYHWQENHDMATYLASIAATIYTRLDDHFVYAPGDTMPITHYVYPSLVANAQTDFNITAPALEFFSWAFGLYPFVDEKYGVALCAIGGGMEHQTLTSYGGSLVTGTHYYDWVFVHEMSHQWFGDMITCKNWVHIWLNEGFASYAEALWFEHLQGPTKLRAYMESKDHIERWSGPILRSPSSTDPWYYFDNVVYDKAAWVLHMLRHVTGDSTFFHILRDYCADPRYRFSAAETNDFRAICEADAGQSLGWFFNEWLTRIDRLTYDWSHTEYLLEGALNCTLVIDQRQDSLYAMPIDFRITTSSSVLDTTFFVDERHEEFHLTFGAGESVLGVSFDPDHWVLCTKNEVTSDATVVPSAVFLDQNFPNPFNPRTVIRFGLDRPSPVRIDVFDARGACVKTLFDGPCPAGIRSLEWDGTNGAGKALASGVYFCRLRTAAADITRKLILLR
jgi:aminopeptidase N